MDQMHQMETLKMLPSYYNKRRRDTKQEHHISTHLTNFLTTFTLVLVKVLQRSIL